MKKTAIATAAALLSVSGVAMAQQMVVASSDLNVRAGPGANHRVVGSLGANDGATVRDCAGNWCRISYAGGEGWVSARYLVDAGNERMTDGRSAARPGSGTTSGVATGAIGGAIIGGPVGAVVGGIAGGAIGAGADAASDNRRSNSGLATGATTGAIGGAIIGGPVGAVVGGVVGGSIGAGSDAAGRRNVDTMSTSSVIPDTVPRSAITGYADGPYTFVWYGGQYLKVETGTGKVVQVIE
jgi:hypothetical protein